MAKMTRTEFLRPYKDKLTLKKLGSNIADALERAGVLEPDPPEQVERIKAWAVHYSDGGRSVFWDEERAVQQVVNHRGARLCQLREVLPGDPDPGERVWSEAHVRAILEEIALSDLTLARWLRAFGLEE